MCFGKKGLGAMERQENGLLGRVTECGGGRVYHGVLPVRPYNADFKTDGDSAGEMTLEGVDSEVIARNEILQALGQLRDLEAYYGGRLPEDLIAERLILEAQLTMMEQEDPDRTSSVAPLGQYALASA